MKTHRYPATVEWSGNRGSGTASYRDYDRTHRIMVAGKPEIAGSSDPSFRGDPGRHNPEELLVASVSACHMLWFLHLCAEAGIVVTSYRDEAEGVMEEEADGSGQFARVVLRPAVRVQGVVEPGRVLGMHDAAHAKCFISRSVRFPVRVEPRITRE